MRHTGKPELPAVLFLSLFVAFSLAQGVQAQGITGLRVNYEVNPLGIDTPKPGFSWQMSSDERGQGQTAYRILVASRPGLLHEGTADIWDSGRVESDHSVQVPYEGLALQPATRYFWTVTVWDRSDRRLTRKDPTWFETGLFQASDWQAKWISAVPDSDTSLAPRPAPFFRKAFNIKKPVQSARLYISGLGYYEAVLNGEKISDHLLDPAVTRYDRRVLYVTHDVTNYLQTGDNVLGVVLGNGWYNFHTRAAWDFDSAPWRDQPVLKAQLHLTYTDGTSDLIPTDRAWTYRTGPILFDGIHNGETYDVRLEIENWTGMDTPDTAWNPAYEVSGPTGRMVAQTLPPIRAVRVVEPVVVTHPRPGSAVYDFGENLAGRIVLTARGPAGAEIGIRHGERLYEDGTLDQEELSRFVFTGETQTARYILGPGQPEPWSPRFAYHGFQFAEVTIPEGVEILDLNAEVVHTDFDESGTFSCSNELINRIHQATLRTYLGNFHGYPTDCPHREKIGWSGDAQLVTEVGLYNFDAVRAYLKWLDDFVDEQRDTGQIPGIIPTSGWGYTFGRGEHRERGYGPQWEAAFVTIPWTLYLHTGDRNILDRYYEPLRRYVDYLATHAGDYTLSFGIDDHKSLTPTAPPILATGFFYTSARLVGRMAAVLGHTSDAARYQELSERIREGYRRRFYDEATDTWGEGNQTDLAGTLYHGLASESEIPVIVNRLVSSLAERGYHLDTGVIGTRYVIEALTEHGRADVVYRLATQTEFPSWGHWIEQGATTLWQNWDGTQSRNHIMFGSIDSWFYTGLAGIQPDEEAPGFKRFTIRPVFEAPLDSVAATHDTVYGTIRSAWRRAAGKLHLDVTVPPNTSARIYLPALSPGAITESRRSLRESPGVSVEGVDNNHLVVRVESGDYRFEIQE